MKKEAKILPIRSEESLTVPLTTSARGKQKPVQGHQQGPKKCELKDFSRQKKQECQTLF